MSLFQKHIEPRCAYCTRCRPLNEEQVVCEKKGVMSAASSCRSFRLQTLMSAIMEAICLSHCSYLFFAFVS